MAGISNFTIEKVVNEIDGDLKANFVGAFPSNQICRYGKGKKKASYPLMIMNTDRSGQESTHWWRLLEISSKEQVFLFDSYGFVGLKEFIIDNDRQMVDEFFYGLENINKNDKKINLTYVQFDVQSFLETEKLKMTKTAQDFFYTLYEFARVYKRKVVNVYMVDDCLQDLKSDTCRIFQLYFYTNLFLLQPNSKIINNRNLTMKTISTLLNEIFVLERQVEDFAREMDVKQD